MHQGSVQHMERHALVAVKWAILRRCAGAGKTTVHGVEVAQEDEEIEEVSINSVYLNKKWSLITADLEMQVSKNTVKIPYKIDTGSEGNLMPLYIFKRLCGHQSVEELKRSIKNNMKLKTYNGMQIKQLGTCMAIIKLKNSNKKCVFFVVPGNGQALLGLPDMMVLNIINLNIDSIQEIRECKINTGQEMYAKTKGCTNKDAQSAIKQDSNGQQHQTNKLINYFYSSNNLDADENKTKAMT